MSSARQAIKTAYNDRVQLTAREKETIDALNASIAADRIPKGYDTLTEIRKSLAKETREALMSAIPDLEERGRAQRERITPEFDRLKGTAWQPVDDPVVRHGPYGSIVPHDGPIFVPQDPILHFPPLLGQPDHVGELWRASMSGFSSDPGLFYDIDQDPLRIFGHIGYTGDALLNGTVGLAMTFILPPERMEYTRRTVFEVSPVLRVRAFVSGSTGFYHPIWAADDKWSKSWESVEVTIMLSSGEWLAGASLPTALSSLEDVYPVGMSNDRRFYDWVPGPLRFTANMRDLRQRGVSILLRAALRYDFQLEGESDIWFRNRGGSASESAPAFDNASTFNCLPGVVTSLP
ncbi:hypothetical protein K7B10_38620 [Streptomyces flavotricini]|uniref:Uncharacterized protein n=1 Tax=Streptomyces flavotricini TaxID=66888 RepID=A0ABS8EHF9_9ACTN|nr:hypothetical protein [Streptomyces flavotricini]MCC0100581.1 hypothetical protein [Streptomyces flavotricini]